MAPLYPESHFPPSSRAPSIPSPRPPSRVEQLRDWLERFSAKERTLEWRNQRALYKAAILKSARLGVRSRLEWEQRRQWADEGDLDYDAASDAAEAPLLRRLVSDAGGASPAAAPAYSSELCDCAHCIHCRRKAFAGFSDCWCSVIFSTTPAAAADDEDEESLRLDDFLSSLGVRRGPDDDAADQPAAHVDADDRSEEESCGVDEMPPPKRARLVSNEHLQLRATA